MHSIICIFFLSRTANDCKEQYDVPIFFLGFCFTLGRFIWINYYIRFIQYFNGSYSDLLYFLLIINMGLFGKHEHAYAGN